jgi:hypothetical protein
MAAKNVYLPTDLAELVAKLDINVSEICQEALRKAVEDATGNCVRCGRPQQSPAAGPPSRRQSVKNGLIGMDYQYGGDLGERLSNENWKEGFAPILATVWNDGYDTGLHEGKEAT